jgi:hypothetical protein
LQATRKISDSRPNTRCVHAVVVFTRSHHTRGDLWNKGPRSLGEVSLSKMLFGVVIKEGTSRSSETNKSVTQSIERVVDFLSPVLKREEIRIFLTHARAELTNPK